MILLLSITKKPKETEIDFLRRATREINARAMESGQSLVDIVTFKNSLITTWEVSPDVATQPEESGEG